jgi:hypothetical protein
MKDPLVMAQTFGDYDPRKYGMDAAAGFPPHNSGLDAPRITVKFYESQCKSEAVKYNDMLFNALANTPSEFTFFSGVCPAWDNEARRPGRGLSFVGSTPYKYGYWLKASCELAMEAADPTERIVFINAWNEWTEGAHLEPDRHYGLAYLAETRRVVRALSASRRQRFLRKVTTRTPNNVSISRSISTYALLRRTVRRAVEKCASAAETLARVLRR